MTNKDFGTGDFSISLWVNFSYSLKWSAEAPALINHQPRPHRRGRLGLSVTGDAVTADTPVNSEGGGTLIGGPNRLLMAMSEASVSQLFGPSQSP